ncbi:MAG TPA: CAP domain-containing protein [Terriglobia bacterium]|nr:CAP domain-containing protein [Terriglobia bacterium]
MKTYFPCPPAAVSTTFFWIAVLAFARPAQTPGRVLPYFAPPPMARAQAVPKALPPGAAQTSDNRTMSGLERQMLALVNRDRRDPANAGETHGRAQSLRWNEKLAQVAREHSRDMLRHRYFSHFDQQGRSPFVRINATGIHWSALAENIAINQTVREAEESFMDEPRFQNNHRGNILDPKYTDVGIGIVQASDGDLYITQDFAAIAPERGAGSRK